MHKDTGHKIYTGSDCQGGEPYVLFGGSSMLLTFIPVFFNPSFQTGPKVIPMQHSFTNDNIYENMFIC
jgi:hypothetical protein